MRASRSPVLERKMQEVEIIHKLKNSFYWGMVNSFGLLFIVYDLTYNIKVYSLAFHLLEIIIGLFLAVNIVFHTCRICWMKCRSTRPEIQETTPPVEIIPDEMEFSCYQRSSWEVVQRKREKGDVMKMFGGYFSSSISVKDSGDIITVAGLRNYLEEYEKAQNSSIIASSIEASNTLTQFCQTNSLTPVDVSPVLKRTVYQTSPYSSHDSMSSTDDGSSPNRMVNNEMWRNQYINPSEVVNWICNLRRWISCTILQRIVDEIVVVEAGLKNQGFAGMTIGHVGLDILNNTAHNIMVAHNVPTLPFLLPFLQVSPNQKYVVQRIRELAVGSSMADFRWKSGGKIDDKEWEAPLPTDAELVMHLISTYFDSQLPLLPSEPEARPFTTQYFCKVPDEPKQTGLVILQKTSQPPHYQLLVDNEVIEVPHGRNNLFNTLILFLHNVHRKYHGMLGRINLGRSGLNMLWIIEK